MYIPFEILWEFENLFVFNIDNFFFLIKYMEFNTIDKSGTLQF